MVWRPVQVVHQWQRWPNPRDGYNTDSWTPNGNEVHYRTNDGQALTAPTRLRGDFTFSAQIRSLDDDDDRLGLVFGWQNPQNHYRLSWEGNFSGGGYLEADGSRGLSLICETGGVPVSLLNLDQVYFRPHALYDVAVWRSGQYIGMTIANLADKTVLAHEAVSDTTFMDGCYGLWNASQAVAYGNILLGPGPDPTVLARARLSAGAPESYWSR